MLSARTISFIFMLLFPFFVKAQTCTFGQPLIKQTFGQGNSTANWYGPLANYAPGAFTSTTFIGPPGRPNLTSNQSGLVKTPATPGNPYGSYWQHHADHTGDENGLMFLIDGIETPTVFFEQKMEGLCPNTTLRLSIWVLNTNSPTINPSTQKPNMFLRVVDSDNNELGKEATGDVPNDAVWHQYSMVFNNNNSSTITLQLINNTPTNGGNDFALDDITVQACGPRISLFADANSNSTQLKMCEGDTRNFTLDANISPEYANAVYQWQEKIGTAWVNMQGKTNKQSSIDFLNRLQGNYQYRLITAINGNIDRVNCRAISEPFTVNVLSKPTPIASNSGAVCIGGTVQLNVDQGVSFNWTGPNGFTSTSQNPTIPNVSINAAGTYTVTVLNASGCSSTSRTNVQVLPAVIANTNMTTATICENESINLEASGGSSYSWLPVDGSLSNPNIAKPVASPKQTTTYQVTVSNGTCSTTKEIIITVLKNPSANAGEDKKLFFGQSVSLAGSTTGDDVTYSWSPTDYLDDPTKLNPIATPPTDMTYTLTVQSRRCGTVTDNVFIKVYPKIEIPNTFTPNGDAKNDTWNIPALEAFPTHEIKIMSRNGQTVFKHKGSYLPWDGKFNNKDVPAGTYYYTIYLNEDFKTLSGWVFVVR